VVFVGKTDHGSSIKGLVGQRNNPCHPPCFLKICTVGEEKIVSAGCADADIFNIFLFYA
jgi:hypothetical protein